MLLILAQFQKYGYVCLCIKSEESCAYIYNILGGLFHKMLIFKDEQTNVTEIIYDLPFLDKSPIKQLSTSIHKYKFEQTNGQHNYMYMFDHNRSKIQ